MSRASLLFHPGPRLRSQVRHVLAPWCLRFLTRLERLVRAWRYAINRLNADDAQRIILDCGERAGWYPLLILTAEDTLSQALEDFEGHEELPRLIAEGCERVGYKWESYNDELFEARRWAIELAERFATDEGIVLVRRTDDDLIPVDPTV